MGAALNLGKILNPGSEFNRQYRDPRWIQRAKDFRYSHQNWCQSCKQRNKQICVHHINYKPGVPLWECEDDDLVLLCDECHQQIHSAIKTFRSAASRSNASNIFAIARVVKTLIDHFGDKEVLMMFMRLK